MRRAGVQLLAPVVLPAGILLAAPASATPSSQPAATTTPAGGEETAAARRVAATAAGENRILFCFVSVLLLYTSLSLTLSVCYNMGGGARQGDRCSSSTLL